MSLDFSERCAAGFALAATIAKDPGGLLAERGIAALALMPLTRLARELAQASKAERRARIRALTEPPAFALPSTPTVPARAYVSLARQARSTVIPDWLRKAPVPRAGYTPDVRLNALLQRIAVRLHEEAGAWVE
jgi:hypothetical protein